MPQWHRQLVCCQRWPSLPHFQQIVSGALMPQCTMSAVFSFLCGQSVCLLFVGWSTIRVPGLWEVSLQKEKIKPQRIAPLRRKIGLGKHNYTLSPQPPCPSSASSAAAVTASSTVAVVLPRPTTDIAVTATTARHIPGVSSSLLLSMRRRQRWHRCFYYCCHRCRFCHRRCFRHHCHRRCRCFFQAPFN